MSLRNQKTTEEIIKEGNKKLDALLNERTLREDGNYPDDERIATEIAEFLNELGRRKKLLREQTERMRAGITENQANLNIIAHLYRSLSEELNYATGAEETPPQSDNGMRLPKFIQP